jgi:hypothetical protein
MLKIKEKLEKVNVLDGSTCDKCKTNICQVELLGGNAETRSIVRQNYDEIKYPDGLHLTYVAGYGTELDGTEMSITLCSPCLYEIILANGGQTVQNRY